MLLVRLQAEIMNVLNVQANVNQNNKENGKYMTVNLHL